MQKRASQIFLDPIQKRASSRSVQLEVVLLKAYCIRIAKTSKFVVKYCITPELGNPQIDVELVSISTFGVVSVAASISDIVVISNVVFGIVVV